MSSKEGLTVFLTKEGATPKKIFRSRSSLDKLVVRLKGRKVGDLFLKPTASSKPAWLNFFSEASVDLPDSLRNSSTSAVFLVRIDRRYAVLTFGHGRHLLEPALLEEQFGLRTVLNSIDPDSIFSIDRKTFDAIATHTRSQAIRRGSAEQFGFDIQRDLLRAVTGIPSNAGLGTRMSGADSLKVIVETSLAGLRTLLRKYAAQFSGDYYQKAFPWIDQVKEVRDDATKNKLTSVLIETLKTSPTKNGLFLAVPEIIDWSRVSGFRYTPKGDLHDQLDVVDFLSSLRDPATISLQTLKTRRVLCVGGGNDDSLFEWPVFRTLNGEFDVEGNRYVLSDGSWYRVSQEFRSDIDTRVSTIGISQLSLPPYDDDDEGAYNSRVANRSKGSLALMDQKLIVHGGGQSRIEFCDLYSRKGRIIHVKRYAGSAPLSHLFSQGLVSARLFLADAEFRRKLNKKLPPKHRLTSPETAPDANKFEVVFAIVEDSNRPLSESLPFFSRVTLATTYDTLRPYGFRVSLKKINKK